MKRVLITGIGGDIAQGIVTILKEKYPEWYFVGIDIHECHAGKIFVDDFMCGPRADDENYFQFIHSVVINKSIDLIIPTSEAEIRNFSNLSELQIKRLPKVLIANKKIIDIGQDKLLTNQYLREINIPVPWTIDMKSFSINKHLPCIIKPRQGSGSRSIYVCETSDDVYLYARVVPDPVLQELLLPDDQEITCGVFRSSSGEIRVVQLLRRLTGGLTSWVKIIFDDDINFQCHKIADSMNLIGSINIQLRITNAGPRIFEINSRFSSTVLIRHRMGFEDLVWAVADLYGGSIGTFSPAIGLSAARVQNASLI